MRDIHDRMPLIVAREGYRAWLDPGNQDVAKLKAFIRSFPAESMEAHPVSRAASNTLNEGAELIKRLKEKNCCRLLYNRCRANCVFLTGIALIDPLGS
jgi:putative SOS response-associated peptidase YedK